MGRLASFVTFAGLLVLASMLLAAVGQPLFTDDAWWHLAHGRAYAAEGPVLSSDPLLFTAPGPPAPAAWLADLSLYSIHEIGGFAALRAGHVLWVAGILGLLWTLLVGASRSRVVASVGTAVFICIAAYRLVQLRPHLFTILAALLLYMWLFASARTPTVRRVAYSVVLLGLWANIHAAFILGPAIIGVGLVGVVVTEAFRSNRDELFPSTRARRIATALVLGTLATCINPKGLEPHFAYLIAGDETPSLARVGDEWASINLFSLPHVGAIPNPLDWVLVWMLLLATAWIATVAVMGRRNNGPVTFERIDAVGLALTAMSFIAMIFAVRFVWLAVFPLLFIASALGSNLASNARTTMRRESGLAAAMLVLIVAFSSVGSWASISRALPQTWNDYAVSYPAAKYQGHAAWFLRDAGLEGNLFAEYYAGGFLGYWLAPELRTFINGSLNVTRDAIDANLPIRERRGARPGETFAELLDRQKISIFMGMRLPRLGSTTRPWFHTTAFLEGVPGWVPIFRNLTSALYLRDTPDNRANFERVAAYYAKHRVPFDMQRGFEPDRVMEASRDWAIAHGLLPGYVEKIFERVNDRSSSERASALNVLAEAYAAGGAYRLAIEIDRELVLSYPNAVVAQRRLTWSLLRSGNFEAAREAAETLATLAPNDALSRGIVAVAAQTANPALDHSAAIARLPVFTTLEAARIKAGMVRPEARER